MTEIIIRKQLFVNFPRLEALMDDFNEDTLRFHWLIKILGQFPTKKYPLNYLLQKKA